MKWSQHSTFALPFIVSVQLSGCVFTNSGPSSIVFPTSLHHAQNKANAGRKRFHHVLERTHSPGHCICTAAFCAFKQTSGRYRRKQNSFPRMFYKIVTFRHCIRVGGAEREGAVGRFSLSKAAIYSLIQVHGDLTIFCAPCGPTH
ncbi:hypothetical protein BC832DRAFT_569280 [Gaertneriomyces semiglobifer]|nr:hypothetical protein BC832DRAFT_569280 [Gaertneriomyces semiglobifer]